MKFYFSSLCLPLIYFFLTPLSYAGAVDTKEIMDTKPNVIIIVADQMRRSAMGFWNKPEYKGALNGVSDPVFTPNIDEIASQGIVFNQAISNYPLCSPFRGMLMSGMYPNKNGVSNNTRKDRDIGLKLEINALTDVLFQSGYNTSLFGKGHWHVNQPLFDQAGNYQGTSQAPGGHFIAQTDYDTYIPPGKSRHSIEYWYQNISHIHKNPVIYSNDPLTIAGKKDGEAHRNGEYSAVSQADKIIEYIKNSRGQRDILKPFSMLWAMDPPHNPYDSLNDTDEGIYNQYYKDKDFKDLLNRPNVDIDVAKKYVKYYFSMVTLIDREIGRVVKTLKEQGIAENTLILFTADHGEMMGSHGKLNKNDVREESLSIPFIVSYPKKLSHRVDNLLISVPDIMPTLLGLVGIGDKIPKEVDGKDYSSLFINANNSEVTRPKSSLYYGKMDEVGVRTHRYTYALNNDGEIIALFDNIKDPYQMKLLSLNNIPNEDSKTLKYELGCWLDSISHPIATEKKFTNLITFPSRYKQCETH
jgi:arylsulfatase A-like enzyme